MRDAMKDLGTRRSSSVLWCLPTSRARLLAGVALAGTALFFLATHHSLNPSPPNVHPIPALLLAGEARHAQLVASRSSSLSVAYANYIAAHGRHPPPGYDAWLYAAQGVEACNIDEFGEMYSSLEVFWGMAPSEVRERQEALAAVHGFGRVRIRNGTVVKWKDLQKDEVPSGGASQGRDALEQMLGAVADQWAVRLPDGASTRLWFPFPRA